MTAAISLIVLLVVLGSSIAVAAGMGLVGIILNQLYSPMPLTRVTGELTWSTTTNFILTAIPFYIMFGEILLRSGIAGRMYNALVPWLSWLPGGLMHSNVAACALFGSVSGSSVATAATIGVVAMGEIDKHKYNEPLFLGTLAAGGTLGILIPPSINMIIYGVMTDTSVPKLYLAGFIPGFILTVFFSLTVLIACIWKPHWGGDENPRQLAGGHSAAARSAAAACPAHDRHRRHFLRHCHGHRIGRRRHRRRACDHRLAPAAHARHAARRLRGDRADDRDGGGDPGRRLLPQHRHPGDRADPAAEPADHGLSADAGPGPHRP